MTESELNQKIVQPSSFRGKEEDRGFLVARGKFTAFSEKELQQIISSGARTDDPRIPEIKARIDKERSILERKHVKDLSSAIFMAVSNHGYATLRCIGRNAVYNATKAIAISTGFCTSKGIKLTFGISFDEGNLGRLRDSDHVNNVTAMVFALEGYKVSAPE